jgi:phenylpropionate dioxygenase-like ring-hydroxylating dioxygenase large terminal subunit
MHTASATIARQSSRTERLPIPNSWYAVAFSDELPPASVLARKLADHDVVIYRTQSGAVTVADAYCPHLGAHLGIGGKVIGEEIQCPFHHFRYDLTGNCVATGYGSKPPPTARLTLWHVCEANGVIFVYYDSCGNAPSWSPPTLNNGGWTPLVHHTMDLHDHPQETVENSVDIGHFAIVHGYTDVQQDADMQSDGSHFAIAYSANRPSPPLWKLFARSVRFNFHADIYGMGCSIVTINVAIFKLNLRIFVLEYERVDEKIDIRMAMSINRLKHLG